MLLMAMTTSVLALAASGGERLGDDATAGDPQEIQACELLLLDPPDERGAVVTWLWPGGLIFYEFDESVGTVNRYRMRSAMNTMEGVSDVHFIPRDGETSYLNIGSFGGNYTYAGQIGGSQTLSIYNWDQHYIICHELMHAMGRYHQHSRTDRNTYITVNYNSIYTDCQSQYDVYSSAHYLDYDFDSVMHYGQWDCSTGGATMTCKPGYEQWQNQMGQRSHLSDGDIGTVEIMYPFLDPDVTVMYVSLGSEELEAGEETSIFSVMKNVGEGAGLDLEVEVRLSEDDVINASDQLIGEEGDGYIYSGDFFYLNGSVTIPAGTADGTWYLGVTATAADDQDATNGVSLVEIQIGDPQPCSGDANGDGEIGVDDMLATIGAWGACEGCPEDANGDGLVGVDDVLIILSGWGPC